MLQQMQKLRENTDHHLKAKEKKWSCKTCMAIET